MARSQRPLIAALISILAALVAVLALLVAVVLQQRGGNSTARPLATATPTLTPTPVLSITAKQGWVQAKTTAPWARNVAFGTNDPLTGYACGQDPKSSNFYFSTTTNGGRTWGTAKALPVRKDYESCDFQVDPANAKDVLMGMIVCDAEPCDGDALIPYLWYRSVDGGQNWNPLVDPPGVSVSEQHGFPLIHQFSWIGSTLYAKVSSFSQSGASYPISNYFLVSKNGGPLTGFDTPQFYAALGTTAIKSLISVPFASNGGIAVFYTDTPIGIKGGISSSDGGKTWTPFTPQVGGGSANALAFDQLFGVGQMLYSFSAILPNSQQKATILRSADGGHSWAPLAVQPPGDLINSSLFITPDNTIFASTANAGGGIVRLRSGATSWDVLVPYTQTTNNRATTYNFKTISWDTNGHPVALWGDIWVYGDKTIFVPTNFGLIYHAPSA